MNKHLTPENTQKLLEWLDSKQIKCDGKIFMPEEDCGYDNAIIDTKNFLASLLSESVPDKEIDSIYPPYPSERDWKEDFVHENGNYECVCSICKNHFYGYKRRVVCKTCAIQYTAKEKIVEEILEKRLNEIRIGETKTEFDIKLIPITSDLAKKIITQVAEIYANELKP